MGSLVSPSSASQSPQTASLGFSCGNTTMENHAGPSTSSHLTASVKQTLRDRESGELDTFLTVELDQAATEYLGLFIKLEPRPVLDDEPDAVPVNRFRKLWSSLRYLSRVSVRDTGSMEA